MVWVMLFLLILLAGAIISFIVSPPTRVVDWFLDKFELHPKISDATVSFHGANLKGEDKLQVIDSFNKAIFVQRYGFLPEARGIPLIISIKKGKNDFTFYVHSYEDHVDVFRENKKKIVAYRLLSKRLQEQTIK